MRRIIGLFVLCLLLIGLAACDGSRIIVVTATPTGDATIAVTQTATPTATPTEAPTPTQEVGFRISYNINGQAVPDWSHLWAHLEVIQPNALLIMDNIGAACDAAQRFPDAIIIHRNYTPMEGDEWHKRPDENQWVAQWQAEGCLKVVRYTTNEPSLYDVAGFVQSEIELMDAAADAGIRLSVGNFGIGTLPDWAVAQGLFDDWLAAVIRGNHIIGSHEYTTGILAFGIGRYSRQQLLDPAAMSPDGWPATVPIEYLPFTAQADLDPVTSPFGEYEQSIAPRPVTAQTTDCGESYPPYWHILRTSWLILRAECIGLEADALTIINTEGLWDNASDIDLPGQITPIQTWRQQYGLEQYMWDMRGIPTYPRLWGAYFPQWSPAEAAVCQMVWWNTIAPPQYKATTLFTWSTNPFWISFDLSGVQAGWIGEVHDLLEYWAEDGDMRSICGDYAWAA